ncbi:MAG TPA: 23S rRNA (guanosine(2251)-2'-O)-methyltransferase RlmB [Clostridiales bacterium]|nr:23S rRNA (guanosine(2251)-2'-O)-methyltransferase RlmB [Clostridiales bacterium]HCU55920.1 23S rRNA (guanosine(2251)-2'-O)-methyltransferase RlmB [Clostridiales bacterium]
MIVEGKNAVKELLKAGRTIDKICVQKGDKAAESLAMQAKEKGAKAVFCSRENLDKLSVARKHQGVIAYTTDFSYSDMDEILDAPEDSRLVVILDGVEDPHNLGSILRSAECLGAAGVVIGKHRAVAVNDTVIKTSCGAAEYVKVARVTNVNDVIRDLKDRFFKVYAMDMDGKELASADLSGDVALVLGAEGSGVSALTKKLCDGAVRIPMTGEIASMNVSVAAGVGMYEYVRQRGLKG